jgi:hypothetical protein
MPVTPMIGARVPPEVLEEVKSVLGLPPDAPNTEAVRLAFERVIEQSQPGECPQQDPLF